MNNFISFITELSVLKTIFLLSGIIILTTLMAYINLKRKIRKDINNQIEKWDLIKENISITNYNWILLFFSKYIEKLSVKHGLNLPVILGLDKLWIKQINNRSNKKAINRVLKYSPDKGLFIVMKAALKKVKLQSILLEWIDKSGEFMILRKIALSSNGENFNGEKAHILFNDRIDEINEMLGDYEWKSRYFAINILINDDTERSQAAIWDSFKDPNIFIRILSIKMFKSDNRHKLYNILESVILNDPSFEVRKAARDRITSDFQDLYNIEPFELTITQQLHLIELMNPESKQDENIAIEFMKTGNKELELYASRFLSRNGTLKRLFLSADPGYAKGFEDTYSILKIAIGVDCTTFIDLSDPNISIGALLLASKILISHGDIEIITKLIEKAISFTLEQKNIQPHKEIYENTIISTCSRGTDEALKMLNSEIIKRTDDKSFQNWVLENLPDNKENIFAPTLLKFLKTENYPAEKVLCKALKKLPVASILPVIIDIIKSEDTIYSNKIRQEALKILGSLNLPHCTQYILENLYILPLEEAKQYSLLLIKNDSSAFRTKVKNILSSGDASSMAHIIAALPGNERKTFLPEIKAALQDSNPEVRIAAVWALSDYNKGEFLSSCFTLLRDPVEIVRKEVGNTLASLANNRTISELNQTLFDRNESLSVKRAILHGLAKSKSNKALNIILLKLEENVELQEETIITLSNKSNQDNLIEILNFMEKTTPVIRENIIRSIKIMGDKAESIIESLLFKDNKILHKHAVRILDDSGIIDLRIRQLAHRDPKVRRKSAEFLMKTGTLKAFRGIIMAAKDPDYEVRIQVVKALDKICSPQGLSILAELKNDPEKRVRRYTLWALERYETKKLA